MATLVEVDGVGPTIGADVWLAPTAVLIGDVRVCDRATIWFVPNRRPSISTGSPSTPSPTHALAAVR